MLDITQFSLAPARSGLQRMLRELFFYWPTSVPGCIGIREDDHYILCDVAYGAEVFENHFSQPRDAQAGTSARVKQLIRDRSKARVHVDRLPAMISGYVLPELTFQSGVLETARTCRERGLPTLAIFADSIPVLQPETVAGHRDPSIDGYFREIGRFDAISCISAQSQIELAERLRRPHTPLDRVHLLGADGLRTGPRVIERHPDGGRAEFFVLGTLERRKRVDLAMEAVRRVYEAGQKVHLVLAGARGVAWPEIDQYLDEPPDWLTWLPHATDDEVLHHFRAACATIFVSGTEGYGLPALEALWHGCPVIVDAALPALTGLAPDGQIRLSSTTVEVLEGVILDLVGPSGSDALREAASRLRLPTWAEWAHDVARWVDTVVRLDWPRDTRMIPE